LLSSLLPSPTGQGLAGAVVDEDGPRSSPIVGEAEA
jgi:hypothetical protein